MYTSELLLEIFWLLVFSFKTLTYCSKTSTNNTYIKHIVDNIQLYDRLHPHNMVDNRRVDVLKDQCYRQQYYA